MPPRVTDVGVPVSPFLDPGTGDISAAWRAFLLSLHIRTGGNIGVDVKALQIEIDAEEAVRAAADQALTAGLAAETQARQTADSNEAAVRKLADDDLHKLITSEMQSRQKADQALVPRAQLCSMWAQCDLSFLPTADPGHGMPWLSNGVVRIGGLLGVGIGLEDASGRWSLEDGSGAWLYG
jgi:hypothetical protein